MIYDFAFKLNVTLHNNFDRIRSALNDYTFTYLVDVKNTSDINNFCSTIKLRF